MSNSIPFPHLLHFVIQLINLDSRFILNEDWACSLRITLKFHQLSQQNT
jgi:hypothetical protein